ncbi:TspO/MBR family protein [Roseibium sp. AS2]|uniref:TspO/MBR family protein n=1 Tax=Roseibium sp. AS2 TaxID=3135781 RepID=UPI00316CE2C1
MKTFPDPAFFQRHPRVLLALFLIAVVGTGVLIGVLSAPGPWYQALRKPPFNPPDWVFAPAWTVLYILIALAGWRSFLRAPRSRVMGIWAGQMLLNWCWMPLFFGLHQIWAAFAVVVLLFVLIMTYIAANWKCDTTAALLFLPYAAWVAFAGLLNVSIALLN